MVIKTIKEHEPIDFLVEANKHLKRLDKIKEKIKKDEKIWEILEKVLI